MAVLRKFRFKEAWYKWISNCIETPRFFVMVNGSPQGLFEEDKGLRQGDPISLFLFIIMAEALGRLVSRKKREGRWKGIRVAVGIDLVSTACR